VNHIDDTEKKKIFTVEQENKL